MLRQTCLALTVALGPVSLGAAAPGGAGAVTPSPPPSPGSAGAVLKNPGGQTVGVVQVQDQGDGRVKISVTAANLPPGFHGIHVHRRGRCDPRSADPATGGPFFSAGAHLGQGLHPDHAGDLPDLLVGEDGTATASYVTDRFTVDRLVTGNGTSLVLHAAPDNDANIPDRYRTAGRAGPDAATLKAGDSGGRIACGVISRR
ncbi:superoxide dismutase family protein [Microbispora sp. NPDC049125]|uniref:superoxide dismutase family protein n=1 Tax=Microbispora sp. NPDC049125 TaxID=3154929 RepID=UPI00346609DA